MLQRLAPLAFQGHQVLKKGTCLRTWCTEGACFDKNKSAGGSCPPPPGLLSKIGPCFEQIKPPEATALRRQGYILVIQKPSVTTALCSGTTQAPCVLGTQEPFVLGTQEPCVLGIQEPCILAMYEFLKSPNPGIADLVGLKMVVGLQMDISEDSG